MAHRIRLGPGEHPARGEGKITVTVADLGDADANGGTGSPIKIVDTLPPGLKANPVVPPGGGPATAIVAEANDGMMASVRVSSESVGSCTEADAHV